MKGRPPPTITPRNRPLTRDLIIEVCKLLKLGNHFQTAVEACGVPANLAERWMRAGETGERGSLYVDFRDECLQAQAIAETRLVEDVQSGKDSARGSLEILKRRFPDRWSEKVQITVNDELERFLDHLKANLDMETYDRVLRITAQRVTAPSALPAASETIEVVPEDERN